MLRASFDMDIYVPHPHWEGFPHEKSKPFVPTNAPRFPSAGLSLSWGWVSLGKMNQLQLGASQPSP